MSVEAVCSEHSGVCAKMENIQKQTDTNTGEIKTIGDAVIKLTFLVEALGNHKVGKMAFWDTDTKKYAIRLGFIFGIILIFALAGTNLLNQISIKDIIK